MRRTLLALAVALTLTGCHGGSPATSEPVTLSVDVDQLRATADDEIRYHVTATGSATVQYCEIRAVDAQGKSLGTDGHVWDPPVPAGGGMLLGGTIKTHPGQAKSVDDVTMSCTRWQPGG